jgi:TPR repeat protein
LSRAIALTIALAACESGSTPRAGGSPVQAQPPAEVTDARAPDLASWRGKCDHGDQVACNNVGFLIENSQPGAAGELYQQACDHDVGNACFNLGYMLSKRGFGDRASPLFSKACGLGSISSCETLRTTIDVEARKTGHIACLEVPRIGRPSLHVCSDGAKAVDWDILLKALASPSR